jgi:uncharacterized protein with HEPN domain
MMKDDTVYLKHISDAITQIESYTHQKPFEEFIGNRMLQDAVVRQLEIIGEAGKNLSDDFRRLHPTIPWSEIVGMRNRIVHDYLNVDMEIVWDIVSHDLPVLKMKIAALLG